MARLCLSLSLLLTLVLHCPAAVPKKGTSSVRKPIAKTASASKKRSTSAKKRTSAKRRPTYRHRKSMTLRVSAAMRLAAIESVDTTLTKASEIPIENPRALVPFFEQLFRHQLEENKEPLRILHYGDSHTAADDWTGAVRELLQSRFGDGGSGYALPGRPFRGYRRYDLKSGASKGWKSEGLLSRDADGLDGMGGVSVTTSHSGEYITLDAECRRLEVFYLQQPEGGSLELTDNGVAVATIDTSGPVEPGYYEFETTPGPHQFRLTTLDSSPVRLLGWVAEKGRGVTYETLGINGAQASLQLKWDEGLQASNIARRNPALIVLAYGTNEASASLWTRESYQQMFAALLQRLRQAAPTSSILVLGPPDRWYRVRGKWQPLSRINMIVEAQREAAIENGCAFFDLREKMGGSGAMRQWVIAGLAQRDHVHFTATGYRRLGYVLFQDLMYNYERYAKIREEVLGFAPPTVPASQRSDEHPRADH
jgi:lysophospholipase L1-like esterase